MLQLLLVFKFNKTYLDAFPFLCGFINNSLIRGTNKPLIHRIRFAIMHMKEQILYKYSTDS